jgi:uncharacterized protein
MRVSGRRTIRSILAALVLGACVHGAPASSGAALWVIEDADSRIYLFGTLHTLRPEDAWRSERIERALRESGELILEAAEADDEAAMARLAIDLGVDMQIDLATRLDADCRADLDSAIATYGQNPQGIARLRPWLAALSFAQLAFARSGYDVQLGVDFALKRDALAEQMTVSSLETAEGQMRRFAELSEEQQIAYLCDTLESAPTLAAKLDVVREAWLRGDTGEIARQLQEGMARSHPELYRSLFVERNQAMAEGIAARLRGSGTSFVAIGAAHLAGSDSVQAQLAARGIRVRPAR